MMVEWQARIVSSLKTLLRLVDPSSGASQTMPQLLISKTASGAFSASKVWHAYVIYNVFKDVYNVCASAADA